MRFRVVCSVTWSGRPVVFPHLARWYTGVLTQPVRKIRLENNNIDQFIIEYLRFNHPQGWKCSESEFASEIKRLRNLFDELLKPDPIDYSVVPDGFVSTL